MEHDDILAQTRRNRTAWEAIAAGRGAALPDGRAIAAGAAALKPARMPISDWTGLRVLHLMCASGEDTLSLAIAGALVTGVDISATNIDHAKRKAGEAGVQATFIAADVYELPDELLHGKFDVVYTGNGAMCWLPDLDTWATTVAAALKDRGRLLVDDMHPLRGTFDVDSGRLVSTGISYFGRSTPNVTPAGPTTITGAADQSMPVTAEFRWPIGDVVTAVARARMRILLLEELFRPPNDPQVPAEVVRLYGLLPNDYVLLACKS